MPDLFGELVFVSVSLLADLLAAIAEDVRQAVQCSPSPTTDLGRMAAKHLRIRGIDSPPFSMPYAT